MATKVKVKKLNETYPWVGVMETDKSRVIVYFTGINEGICLAHSSIAEPQRMEYMTKQKNWNESNFKPCEVTIRSV